MKNNKPLIILVVILVLGLAVIFYQISRGQDNEQNSEKDGQKIINDGSAAQLNGQQGPIEDITYSNPGADYTIIYPSSWVAQEAYANITVLGKPNGTPNPPTIVLGISTLAEVEATTPDEWFTANGLENNEAIEVVTREEVDVNGTTMTLIIQNELASQAKIMHYVYFSDDGKVIILSHAPYITGSVEATDFDGIIQSLVIQ